MTCLARASGALGALLVLSGCGAGTSTTIAPRGSPISVHDQVDADTVARDLLGRALLPPGSAPTPAPPTAVLDHPPQSLATPNLAEATRFAVAPGSPTQDVTYLMGHRPAGFTKLGSGSGSAGSNTSTSFQFVIDGIAGLPEGVNSGRLLITVAPGGAGGSAIRVDAQVTWLPPKPPGATVPGDDRVAVVSILESLPENPGLPPPRRVVITDQAAVARLAAAADQLPAALPATRSCPADLGTSYVVAFAPATRAAPDITYTTGSCGEVVVTSHAHQVGVLSSDQDFDLAYRQVLGQTG